MASSTTSVLAPDTSVRLCDLSHWIDANRQAIGNTIRLAKRQRLFGTLTIVLSPLPANTYPIDMDVQPLLSLLLLALWKLVCDHTPYNDHGTTAEEEEERRDAATVLLALEQLEDSLTTGEGSLAGLHEKMKRTGELKAIVLQGHGERSRCWHEEEVLEVDFTFQWATKALAKKMEKRYNIGDILHSANNGYPFYTHSSYVSIT
jgi:hypothetical protein